MAKTGVLLLNLGTPDDPHPPAVGRYLRQFLMDELVIDIPALLRWILVKVLIVPRRAHTSAEAYQKIWTERGSPLRFHTEDLAAKVQALLSPATPVRMAMRYGNPSVESALQSLRQAGAEKLVILPLYPQYSLAATESSVREARRAMKAMDWNVEARFVPAFYADPGFIEAFHEVIRGELSRKSWDHVLFSFHGLPERHVKKTDPSAAHCLATKDCCATIVEANRDCYRAQCFHTAHALARKLELKPEQYSISFQSRLGRTEWIKPYTDHLYEELPKRGVKKLAVACPAFVADCLETLEEISMRGLESWQEAGGDDLFLIPSLNSTDAWARTVARLAGGTA